MLCGYRHLPLPMTYTYRHLPLPVFIILASTVINLLQPLQNYKQYLHVYLLHNVVIIYADLFCILFRDLQVYKFIERKCKKCGNRGINGYQAYGFS